MIAAAEQLKCVVRAVIGDLVMKVFFWRSEQCSRCSHIMLNKVCLAKDKTPTEVSERNVLFWGLSGKVFFWGKRYVFGRGWDSHESVSLESSFWNLSVKVLFGRSALLRLCESCSLLPYYVKQGMFRLPRKCQLGKQRKFFFPLENFSTSAQISRQHSSHSSSIKIELIDQLINWYICLVVC